jgi:uncharacterized Zn-binding protein involved in type VI secretion
MLFAARVTDLTAHGGVVGGPGVTNVLIGGLPAAVVGDVHTCGLVPHVPTFFTTGSARVVIGGRFALRVGDLSVCGSPIVGGLPSVLIGN